MNKKYDPQKIEYFFNILRTFENSWKLKLGDFGIKLGMNHDQEWNIILNRQSHL